MNPLGSVPIVELKYQISELKYQISYKTLLKLISDGAVAAGYLCAPSSSHRVEGGGEEVEGGVGWAVGGDSMMLKSTCKHCGEEIGEWADPWGGHREWMHAPDDGPDAYQYCHCQCDACKSDTTLGFNDPCTPNCCDGEEAEPVGVER